MLESLGALFAEDVAPVIQVEEADGAAYWTAGAYCTADPAMAARFQSIDDAMATLLVLRTSGVLDERARVSALAISDDAKLALLRL